MSYPYKPGQDGIDHINAYSRSKSRLGVMLSNFYESPINLGEKGSFQSIEGLWFWLKTGDEKLRFLSGPEAKKYGSELPVTGLNSNSREFKFHILRAVWEKINTNPEIKDLLTKSSLPIVHYYVRKDTFENEFAVPVKQHDWEWNAIEVFRDYLQTGREPKSFYSIVDIEEPYQQQQFGLF